MNPEKELSKIQTILKEEKFDYRGVQWKLDLVATMNDKKNQALQGKPLVMLTGSRTDGEQIKVWSHDVEVSAATKEAEPDIDPVLEAIEVTEPVTEKIVKPVKKSKKKSG